MVGAIAIFCIEFEVYPYVSFTSKGIYCIPLNVFLRVKVYGWRFFLMVWSKLSCTLSLGIQSINLTHKVVIISSILCNYISLALLTCYNTFMLNTKLQINFEIAAINQSEILLAEGRLRGCWLFYMCGLTFNVLISVYHHWMGSIV